MTTARSAQVGLFTGVRSSPPEQIIDVARAADRSRFGELWTAEDYFLTGAFSALGMTLASTERISVGVGIVPVHTRHPALIAMESSTLARAFPGRFILGIGTGVTRWQDQMGTPHGPPLASVREAAQGLRALLAGETLTRDGQFTYEAIQLAYPAPGVPLHLAAMGPKMLQEAGAWADGTILAIAGSSTEYLRYAREHIEAGAARIGRSLDEHVVTVLVPFAVADHSEDAIRALYPQYDAYLGRVSAKTDIMGISDELRALQQAYPEQSLAPHMPQEWIRRTAVVGNHEECAASIRRILSEGADRVILHPPTVTDPVELIERTDSQVLSLL